MTRIKTDRERERERKEHREKNSLELGSIHFHSLLGCIYTPQMSPYRWPYNGYLITAILLISR